MEAVQMQDNTLEPGSLGPVTASRHRRNALIYAALCVLGLSPTWLSLAPGWQAAGLGLLVPGGGFLALGPLGVLGVAATLGLFWLSCIVWFWCGMVVAPIAVWLGAAALAGNLVGDHPWAAADHLVALLAAGLYFHWRRRGQQRAKADAERLAQRRTFFAESLAEVRTRTAEPPAPGSRELAPEQISALRYALDRALQPVGQYAGYTVIDQFQPAALRYQINHLGYALAMAQCHYTPSFHGYLAQAQRNLIETYLNRRVWDYWVLESMWGHFNFTNFDPAAKDNIMLTGYFGMQVNQYMLVTGDRRYAEPGSLTFRLNDRTAFPHDAHTLVGSVRWNHGRSDFCLFPCEPNWVYPVCNMYGMGALASHDRVFGTDYVQQVAPRWHDNLAREFTDGKGSLIGLRSYWLGLEIPFYAGEAGFAFFANVFDRTLAERLWAIGRKELSYCIAPDANGRPRLSIPPEALTFLDTIDPGNYRRGALFAYAAVGLCAREFGDDELAEAAINSMDQDCGRVVEDGVARYEGGSGWANIWAIDARLMRTGDFRRAFVEGPPESVLRGPLLETASYPEVLVAKAFSDGEDLDLVLYNGRAAGPQVLEIGRLQPGRAYRVTGALEAQLTADAQGKAALSLVLDGRTPLHLVPA